MSVMTVGDCAVGCPATACLSVPTATLVAKPASTAVHARDRLVNDGRATLFPHFLSSTFGRSPDRLDRKKTPAITHRHGPGSFRSNELCAWDDAVDEPLCSVRYVVVNGLYRMGNAPLVFRSKCPYHFSWSETSPRLQTCRRRVYRK